MNKTLQILIAIAMIVVIVALIPQIKRTYLEWEMNKEVENKYEFNIEKKKRYKVISRKIEFLKTAESIYKDRFEEYTDDWEKIGSFIKTDSVMKVTRNGHFTDEMIESGITMQDGIKRGIISFDTSYVAVSDSMGITEKELNELKTISGNKNFTLEIEGEKDAQTLRIKAHNNDILTGLSVQLIISENDKSLINEEYPGIMYEMK
jgi:hypothetical protein